MNPNGADIQVNIPLQLVQDAYILGQNEFIADQIFPVVSVQKKVGTYWKWNKGEWYRSEAQLRAPATQSVGSGFGLAQGNLYNCDVYAFHRDLDRQTRDELDAQGLFNLESMSARFVTRQLLLKREQIFASKFFTTGVWGTEYTGVASGPSGSQFVQFDQASSNPVGFIGGLMDTFAETTGLRPNIMVTTPRVLRALRLNAQIEALAANVGPYTGNPLPTSALISSVLELPRVVVANTIINTAVEGATDAFTPLYGKHIFLGYAAPDASIETPSAGYIFNWTGYTGASFAGNAVYTFEIPELRSERVEAEMAFDMQAVSPLLGIFLANAIA